MDADLIVVDIKREWTVDKEKFISQGKNTPFNGWQLKGKILMAFKGKQVFDMRNE